MLCWGHPGGDVAVLLVGELLTSASSRSMTEDPVMRTGYVRVSVLAQ
jgi:hypothetical protein